MATHAVMRQRGGPVTQLYDSASELLFAAQQLRAAAADRGSVPATAATVGCIHATFDALAQAVDAMRCAAVKELNALSVNDGPSVAIEREFASLADAIRVAQETCDRTRERTAPVLA